MIVIRCVWCFSLAIVHDREDQTGGRPCRTLPFFAIIHDREDQTGDHPWPHSSIICDHP